MAFFRTFSNNVKVIFFPSFLIYFTKKLHDSVFGIVLLGKTVHFLPCYHSSSVMSRHDIAIPFVRCVCTSVEGRIESCLPGILFCLLYLNLSMFRSSVLCLSSVSVTSL